MEIKLENISQRFDSQWIFKNLNFSFSSNQIYGISGPNGSGKSTLMKIISGGLEPTKGNISWDKQPFKELSSTFFKNIGFAAPYIDIPYWLTLNEFYDFHFKMKASIYNQSISEILEISELSKHRNKAIQTFSSGMKQRVKLISAIVGNYKTVILDEPTTNLDDKAKTWFQELLKAHSKERLIIIASNEKSDFQLCNEIKSINTSE